MPVSRWKNIKIPVLAIKVNEPMVKGVAQSRDGHGFALRG